MRRDIFIGYFSIAFAVGFYFSIANLSFQNIVTPVEKYSYQPKYNPEGEKTNGQFSPVSIKNSKESQKDARYKSC